MELRRTEDRIRDARLCDEPLCFELVLVVFEVNPVNADDRNIDEMADISCTSGLKQTVRAYDIRGIGIAEASARSMDDYVHALHRFIKAFTNSDIGLRPFDALCLTGARCAAAHNADGMSDSNQPRTKLTSQGASSSRDLYA